MTIDVDIVFGWSQVTSLIILHPTGVKYSGQCGGMACTHPEAEGYVIGLNEFAESLTGCDYGCNYLPDMPEQQKKFAEDFDKYCEKTKDWTYQISFDYDRVSELQEGWIPVKINGKMDELIFNDVKGFIHNGNCD